MADLHVDFLGKRLAGPVVAASGTFGFGYEFAELYDINILGTFSFKGTTREARFGNPTPRIAECTAGMINAVGLQNPGVEAVIAREALAQSAAVCCVVPAQLGDSIGDVAALTIAIEFSQKNGKSVTDYGA